MLLKKAGYNCTHLVAVPFVLAVNAGRRQTPGIHGRSPSHLQNRGLWLLFTNTIISSMEAPDVPQTNRSSPDPGPVNNQSAGHHTPRTPNPDIDDMAKPNESRLLSLPKELRLEIWQHVLLYPHDPHELRHVLRITREPSTGYQSSAKRLSNTLYKYPKVPEIKPFFEYPPISPIGVSLLRTNHLIYTEALPILYHSVSFCPYRTDGTFALFLEQLSDLAKANIRYVRLYVTCGWISACEAFRWAVTCAHVAGLQGLREVEVILHGTIMGDEAFYKRAVLAPLLQIGARKVCRGYNGERFERLMAEAAAERDTNADLRAAAIEAGLEERMELADPTFPTGGEPPVKKQKLQRLSIRGKLEKPIYPPAIDEREIVRELAEIPGFEHPEDPVIEPREWDYIGAEALFLFDLEKYGRRSLE
jgi:hypothetical protein